MPVICFWSTNRHRSSSPEHQSAAAVLKLSILCDGELGGVGGRQAIAEVVHAVSLFHLSEGTHQPRVSCIQGADPLLLQERERSTSKSGGQMLHTVDFNMT